MRVYHDDTVPDDLLDKLRQYGVELRDMTQSGLSNKMTWRFTVASDASVDRFIIRDLDSRLSIREKAAVDEWILSGKKFHIMRDHPSHSMFAMSGGMWGGTGDAVPQMHELITRQRIDTVYVADMNFLTNEIWPLAQQSVLQHDAFSCNSRSFAPHGAKGWPMPRVGSEHIGSVYLDKHADLRGDDVSALLDALRKQPATCKDRGDQRVVPPQTSHLPGCAAISKTAATATTSADGWTEYNTVWGDASCANLGESPGAALNKCKSKCRSTSRCVAINHRAAPDPPGCVFRGKCKSCTCLMPTNEQCSDPQLEEFVRVPAPNLRD